MLRKYLLSMAVIGCLGAAAVATQGQAAPVQPSAQVSAAATPTVEKAQYRYDRRRSYHRRRHARHRRNYRY